MSKSAPGQNGPTAKTQKAAFWVCFFAGVVGGIVATLAIVLILYLFVDIDFVKNATCGVDGKFHYCFFDKAWDSGEYLSAITTFYGTIITILIGFLAILATLAFLVVRISAGHHAQESMEGEVERYFASNAAVISIEGKLGALADTMIEQRTRELAVRLETIITVLEEDGYDIPGTIATQ
jgi:large-conductance mechanosensitive channel